MDQLVIRGGKSLQGEVEVSGAKNAALPLLAASLLTEEPLRLSNVPRLMDVRTMSRLLRHIGVEVTGDATPEMTLQSKGIQRAEAPHEPALQRGGPADGRRVPGVALRGTSC